MSETKLYRVSFEDARESGEIVDKSGYHKPDDYGRRMRGCGCKKTTPKGAYRDVTVEMGDCTVHFYHQTPVVVESGGRYRLDSGGYRTSTTKERMNRHLPRGYTVIQRDFEWYVETPNGRVDFEDGMVIDTNE